MEHVLTYMVFIPLAGMVVVLLLPGHNHDLIRWVSAAFTAPPLLMAAWLYANFDPTQAGFQFEHKVAWIPAYNIHYYVGVDGVSISMVLLTALLCFLCVFASWGIDKAVKGYFALFLLLDTGMMGVFVALDFFLFYIFWEVMLLPMYFLIGIWGGPRKIYAAIKFFLYTMAGSILMLLAILYLGISQGTFSVPELIALGGGIGLATQSLLFWGFAAAFAIKVPVWPLHFRGLFVRVEEIAGRTSTGDRWGRVRRSEIVRRIRERMRRASRRHHRREVAVVVVRKGNRARVG